MAKYILNNNTTKALIFDMAGTIVRENGVVYKTLHETLNMFDISVSKKEINDMAGAHKHEVITHFFNDRYPYKSNDTGKTNINKNINRIIIEKFENNLKFNYRRPDSLALIDPTLKDHLANLRLNGYKIALNTGYSRDLQETIINKLELHDFIDTYVSSEDVTLGRPEPFMIYQIMSQLNIKDATSVIKVGDTINDILEGKNANCRTIGVLTGANNKTELLNAGANVILDSVMDITIE